MINHNVLNYNLKNKPSINLFSLFYQKIYFFFNIKNVCNILSLDYINFANKN